MIKHKKRGSCDVENVALTNTWRQGRTDPIVIGVQDVSVELGGDY